MLQTVRLSSFGNIKSKSEAPSLLCLSVRGFRRAGSPGSCCSRWRSSPAAWRPTARCWSPLRQCRPGWDPRWPAASVGCPRSELGGRQLRREDVKSSWLQKILAYCPFTLCVFVLLYFDFFLKDASKCINRPVFQSEQQRLVSVHFLLNHNPQYN